MHYLTILLPAVAHAAAFLPTTCKITTVSSVYCGIRGWVQTPDVVHMTRENSELDCGGACLAMRACQSIRYIADSGKCYMYGKFLEDMYLDTQNYQTGRLWNRECFTTDCAQIAACKKTSSCIEYTPLSYEGNVYRQYACDYGYEAVPYNEDYDKATYLFAGNLTSCEAVAQCAASMPNGAFDVHYLIPSNKWECFTYENELDYYDPSYYDQDITPKRYSKRNSTIGEGYGYFQYARYGD